MKSYLIAWLLSTTGLFAASAQAKGRAVPGDSAAVRETVLNFLREVYQTQDEALKIARQYIELDNSPGSASEYSDDKRYRVAAANITLLREGKGVSSFSPPLTPVEITALQIVPYARLTAAAGSKLLDFGLDAPNAQHLYVALKDGVVWKYFYVDKNKISSFDYLLKGEGARVYLFDY